MPRQDKYTAWCSGCGIIFEEDTNIASQKLQQHRQECVFVAKMNDYFDANVDKADNVKKLLTWFNSFKTLQEYLNNNKDISKINRTDFYHDSSNWNEEYLNWFNELRGSEQTVASSSITLSLEERMSSLENKLSNIEKLLAELLKQNSEKQQAQVLHFDPKNIK